MSALRLIRDRGYGARGNVALTAAMAELHAAGKIRDTLRIYRYPQSVLIGRNQNAAEAADITRCAQRGAEIARRITGGGAIYVDRGVVTFDLVIAAPQSLTPRGLSEKVCRAIAANLSEFGADAQFRPENDIFAGGRKIFGASGFADGGTFVYQGSLMLAPDLEAMAEVLRLPSLTEYVTTLAALMGRDVSDEEIETLLSQPIAKALDRWIASSVMSEDETRLQGELLSREFGQDDFVFHGDASERTASKRAAA